MASVELTFLERADSTLGGDGFYDWVDVKHFALRPSGCRADEALGTLIAHVRFRDSYADEDSYEHDSVSIHGPYELASIGVASYEPVSADVARETLESFVMLYGGGAADDADRMKVMTTITSPVLDAADEIYRLRDLGDAARHEWGWVVRDFTELVAIDRSAGRLSLIVAAQD
jgi:hypothetical protein